MFEDPDFPTATELADALDQANLYRHNNAGLSMLDQDAYRFGMQYPAVKDAYWRFGQACTAHKNDRAKTGTYSDELWDAAMLAARELAVELRRLGDVRVACCERPTPSGPCGRVLVNEDGWCGGEEHLDADQPTDEKS